MITYLEGNRDYLVDFIHRELPGFTMGTPEATYLAWLDCRNAGIEGNPQKFFMEKARVAFGDGEGFGKSGKGFVRINFGCTRKILATALEQVKQAMKELPSYADGAAKAK